MTDQQKQTWATILWVIGLCLLFVSLLMTQIIHVHDTYVDSDSGFMILFNIFAFHKLGINWPYGIATICAFISLSQCCGGDYYRLRWLIIFPILTFLLGLIFMPVVLTFEPAPYSSVMETRIGWSGYFVWMLALTCILASGSLQCSVNTVTDDMKGKRSIIELILGGQPSICQTIFFFLMLLPLPYWPMALVVAPFLFDAPIHNAFDEIGRFGMIITALSYPLYLLPLLRFAWATSFRTGKKWTFYVLLLIPIVFFLIFVLMTK